MPTAPDLAQRLAELPAAAPLRAVLAGDSDVWVVGGAVRDLLLGGQPGDLDLVVEGDAAAVAGRLAEGVAGAAAADGAVDVRVHDRFGTATVRVGGHAYDVVRARAETYARPGALPDVRPGTLAEDLARRDFAVNAIAVSLAGELRAVPHALEDLGARRLRVLHDASFRDDPTRLLRLVRYATRLGFAVEERTAALAAEAVAGGALATVTGTRVGRELRLLLAEPSAVEGLAWVAQWGGAGIGGAPTAGIEGGRGAAGGGGAPTTRIERERTAGGGGAGAGRRGGAIVPGLAVDRAVAERAAALLPGDGRSDLLLLAGAARAVPSTALAEWLDELGFAARERDTVVTAAGDAARAGARLAEARRPSQIADALRGAPPELAALAGAVGGEAAEAAARSWLTELRHVRLEIDGDDLLAAGVPRGEAVGRGLRAALAAALDGAAPDRAAQLAAAVVAARGD